MFKENSSKPTLKGLLSQLATGSISCECCHVCIKMHSKRNLAVDIMYQWSAAVALSQLSSLMPVDQRSSCNT